VADESKYRSASSYREFHSLFAQQGDFAAPGVDNLHEALSQHLAVEYATVEQHSVRSYRLRVLSMTSEEGRNMPGYAGIALKR